MIGLTIKNDYIVLDCHLENNSELDVVDFLNNKFAVSVEDIYVEKNVISPGNIDWDDITEDIKRNWNNSLFFMEKMNDDNFVNNNKNLILEKVIDVPDLLVEAIEKNKSMNFLNYCIEKVEITELLTILKDHPKQLANIWEKKIKNIISNSNMELMKIKLNNERIQMEKDLEFYRSDVQTYNYRNYREESWKNYDYMTKKFEKDLKKRTLEIKEEVMENKKLAEVIYKIIENKEIKLNLVKRLVNNEILRDDFLFFEKEIIENKDLRNYVIKSKLKNNPVTKNFVSSLNEDEFSMFLINTNNNIKDSLFISDSKRYLFSIIEEEQLISFFKLQEANNIKTNLKCLNEMVTKNETLKFYLFKNSPKDRFSDFSKKEITEEHIKAYLEDDGYIHEVMLRTDIYNIKDVDVIKMICNKDAKCLNNKKTPEEWKNNPEIIDAALLGGATIENINLKKENVNILSKDINNVINFVKKDKSYKFYNLLSNELKNNKKVAHALMSLAIKRDVTESVFKLLPPMVLMDKMFNIRLIVENPSISKLVNSNLWNDKEFVLSLFSEIEGTKKEQAVKKEFPEKIRLFLETFNVDKNFYTFFSNYYLQKKLDKELIDLPIKEKSKKIKI